MTLPRKSYPIHKMVLPSNNKTVSFRPYLVKEEKILLMATESGDEKQILTATKQILRNCILDTDFDINTMAVFDMQYAFVQLRAKSVGEIAELKVICNKCNHPNDYKLNFSTIRVEIPADINFKIPLDGNLGITMQYPSISAMDKFIQANDKNRDLSVELIMACIKNIWDDTTVYDPHTEPLEEQVAFIESLGRSDMEKLESFTQKIPTITSKIEFTCTKCGEKNERVLGGLADFF